MKASSAVNDGEYDGNIILYIEKVSKRHQASESDIHLNSFS